MAHKEHELVSILFADIANYTALMQKHEDRAKVLLDAFQTNLSEVVSTHNGQIVNFYGDGALAKFSSVESAIHAANNLQRKFRLGSIEVPVRIGLHLGEVFSKDGNIYGDSVNIASRIESFGVPGSILLSEEVYNQIRNKEAFEIKKLGQVSFKNDKNKRTIFALNDRHLVVPRLSQLKGKGKKHSNKFIQYLIPLILIAAIAGYFVLSGKKDKASRADLTSNSIAVLPLLNLNADKENLGYLSDGLTQEIIDELAKINSLKVTPFTQSVFYKSSDISADQIARQLAVKFLVSGSVRLLTDDKIKLSLELFDPVTKDRVWNQVFEEEMKDAPLLQTAIARNIAKSLELTLSEDESDALNTYNTESGEAFKLFLQAKSEMDKFEISGFANARALLSQAIDIDPNYAQAYTLKAWSMLLSADPTINPDSIFDQTILGDISGLLDKAIELRPEFSDNYLVRSNLALFGYNKIQDAIKDVEYAIELNSWPRVPTNYCTCAMILAMTTAHKFQRANEIIEIAEEIDPMNILQTWDKGNLYMTQNDMHTAENLFREAYEENNSEYFKIHLAISLYHQQKYDEILELFDNELTSGKVSLNLSRAYLSNTLFKLGRVSESDKLLQDLNAAAYKGNSNMYLAMTDLGRDDIPGAIEHLNKAYDNNEFGLAVTTSTYPIFRSLSENATFIKLRSNMQFE